MAGYTRQSTIADGNTIDASLFNNEYNQLVQSVTTLNTSMDELGTMSGDLDAIKAALSSGDSTVLGLVGRLEYIEQSMESVNAHRLQINESLFRLQESIEALQRVSSVSSNGI